MNKQRRERIEELRGKLGELLHEAGEIRDEEQEYFDNMPESLQGSDRGDKSQEDIGYLSACFDAIEEADTALDSID